MEVRTLAVAAAILVTLVVGAQLAYTTVGQPVGPWFTEPIEVASVSPDADAEIRAVAADGDGQWGAIGWIARFGEEYRVMVVRVEVDEAGVSLGSPRRIASADQRLQGLDVAVSDGVLAMTWERALDNAVVLYRSDRDRPQVVSDAPLRVAEPTVAIVEGGTVLAWQEWNGSASGIELVSVIDETSTYRTVPVDTVGRGSPTVDAAGDGFAVTWFDGQSQTVETAFGRVGAGGIELSATETLGQARPSGGFGGGQGSMSMGASAGRDRVRGIWVDVISVTTAEGHRDGGVTEPTTLGRGERPRVAVAGDRWLATWVAAGRDADTDLAFAAQGERQASGVLSRFQSSGNHPSPFYGPNAAVAWSERGAQSRVLVSGLLEAPDQRYAGRLRAEPGRIVFVGIAAAVLGLVTLPVMPWVVLSLLAAFYFTNRLIRRLAERLIARMFGLVGRSPSERAVRERLETMPPTAWVAAFAVGEVAVLVVLLPPVGTSVSLSFAGPIALSVAAAIGTGLLQLVSPQRSPWRIAAVFLYFQTAALWATALPDVL